MTAFQFIAAVDFITEPNFIWPKGEIGIGMNWFLFWLGSLATYRVTVLLTRCLGPYGIFAKLRKIDRCSRLLTCPYCVSIHVGALTCVALLFAGVREPIALWILTALAFSAITIALDRIFSSDHVTS